MLECAGTASAAALALELVTPLGRVVIVGISGAIPSAALIDDVIGFESAEETFRALVAAGNRRVKVLLDPALRG